MTSSAPIVSVIIVNYNSGPRLKRCLEHLLAQTFREFEIIIVDNASTDDSLADAGNAGADFQLIDAGANLGFAAANNLAAQSARGEWLAFLNPDAYAAPDWIEALMAAVHAYPGVDAFGSLQLNDDAPDMLDGAGDACSAWGVYYRGFYGWPASFAPDDGECFAPCAAAALYRRSRFLDLGGFDERFFCYGEDVDLGFRLRLAGGRAMQLRNAVVRHEGSGVTGRRSGFTVYHGHRNRIWLYYKNLASPLYWLTAPMRLAADLALGAKAFLSGGGGAYLRAIRDGYAGCAAFTEDRRLAAKSDAMNAVATCLVWSPFKVLRRKGKLLR